MAEQKQFPKHQSYFTARLDTGNDEIVAKMKHEVSALQEELKESTEVSNKLEEKLSQSKEEVSTRVWSLCDIDCDVYYLMIMILATVFPSTSLCTFLMFH